MNRKLNNLVKFLLVYGSEAFWSSTSVDQLNNLVKFLLVYGSSILLGFT